MAVMTDTRATHAQMGTSKLAKFSLVLSALARSGQKEAAKKELDAVIKLGGKYAGQAEAAKVVLGL